jgi:hypothetical protein
VRNEYGTRAEICLYMPQMAFNRNQRASAEEFGEGSLASPPPRRSSGLALLFERSARLREAYFT